MPHRPLSRMRRLVVHGFALLAMPAQAADPSSAGIDLAPVPLVGAPCEGCEAAFVDGPAALAAALVLAPVDEPGERLVWSGRVRDREGLGVAGIVLYLHQTDHQGLYPPNDTATDAHARRHGRLRGWLRSDIDGSFRVETIRPGGYPGTGIPQHIHVQVIEPGCATYFIDDLMFRDDPRLTPELERQLAPGVGGPGVVAPQRVDGAWRVERDVVLGLGVARYPRCGRG